jgi:hypothetical protein
VIDRCDADEGGDLASIEGAEFGKFDDQAQVGQ